MRLTFNRWLPRLFKANPGKAAEARLRAGALILETVLGQNGFSFRFQESGASSGGPYASGEFIRGERRLEVHVGEGLGLVRYHVGRHSASHQSYMDELGVLPQCQYPSFPNDPLDPFVRLAHDLRFAREFLNGDARLLLRAAHNEFFEAKEQDGRELQRYVGDVRTLEQMRVAFREHSYARVVQLAQTLALPKKMTVSQRRMLEIATARALSGEESR